MDIWYSKYANEYDRLVGSTSLSSNDVEVPLQLSFCCPFKQYKCLRFVTLAKKSPMNEVSPSYFLPMGREVITRKLSA
jgi:hypothetical protein